MIWVMSLNLSKAWGCGSEAGPSGGAHPTPPNTLHPTPYTLHPVHPTPFYTLHPTPYTVNPAGLADWLFEADGDAGTEAGCASAGGIRPMRLIPFLTVENTKKNLEIQILSDILIIIIGNPDIVSVWQRK